MDILIGLLTITNRAATTIPLKRPNHHQLHQRAVLPPLIGLSAWSEPEIWRSPKAWLLPMEATVDLLICRLKYRVLPVR